MFVVEDREYMESEELRQQDALLLKSASSFFGKLGRGEYRLFRENGEVIATSLPEFRELHLSASERFLYLAQAAAKLNR
jgi:hypothetical protein